MSSLGARFAHLLRKDGELVLPDERLKVQLQGSGRVLLADRRDQGRLPVGHPAGEDEAGIAERAELQEDKIDGVSFPPRCNLIKSVYED